MIVNLYAEFIFNSLDLKTANIIHVNTIVLGLLLILVLTFIYLYRRRLQHLANVLDDLSEGDYARRSDPGMLSALSDKINSLGESLEDERSTKKNYRQLVENGRDIIFTISAGGVLTSISAGIKRMLGYSKEDWIEQSFKPAVHPNDLDEFMQNYEATLKGDEPGLFRIRVKDKSGNYHHLEYALTPQTENGEIIGIIGIARDVTERVKAERELRESRELLRKTFDSLEEAVFILQPETRVILDCNMAAEKIFGYTKEEMINNNTSMLHLDEEKYHIFDKISVPKLEKQGVFHNEFAMKRKDGSSFYTNHTVSLVHDEDGEIDLIVSVVRDITEKKKARKNLEESRKQLRHLARHLQTLQEEERKRISQDIHDELGQILTTMQLDISWIEEKLPLEQEAIMNKIDSLFSQVEQANETVQRVTTQLRPKILDDLGFDAAVEWEAKKVEERSDIQCQIQLEMEGIDLNKDASIILYRILQEALTNVLRHANASRIRIRFRKVNSELELVITDNGRGIRNHEIHDIHSHGLSGMRERARSWSGSFSIRGIKDIGTTVKVTLPLDEENRIK